VKVEIEYIDPDDLNPAPYNPRRASDEALKRLAGLMDVHGFIDPVIARKEDGLVIGGHQRLKANKLRANPDATVPVVFLAGVSDTRAKALNIALNNQEAQGEYDMPMLADLLQDIDTGEFEVPEFTAFSEDDIAGLMHGLDEHRVEEDEAPGLQGDAVSRTGDLWLMGEHRLLCGDSTSADDADALMGGDVANMMWTDPPYGVSYVGKTKDALTIENDGADGLSMLLSGAFAVANRVLNAGAPVYIARPPGVLSVEFGAAFVAAGWHFHEELQWVKDTMVLGHSDYHLRHETVIYGWTDGANHPWYAGRAETSVFEIARPKASPDHPTGKPVALVIAHMGNSSKAGDIVLEPFSGSGTTIIACEQLNRKCHAIEIDPRYVDVAVRRWQNLTGKDATLDGDGRTFAEIEAERA